jgi:purine nucleosidase
MEMIEPHSMNLHCFKEIISGSPVIIDTDYSNEVDDAFALTYALLSPLQIKIHSIQAAPYVHIKSPEKSVGLDRSVAGIKELLGILGKNHISVYRGAENFITERMNLPENEAAKNIITACKEHDHVTIVAIGALTNIASAIRLEPEIIKNITLVWLGGHSFSWPHTKEFNLEMDPAAVQIVLDSSMSLIWVPCMGVASHLQTNLPEIAAYVKGQGDLGNYLFDVYFQCTNDHFAYSRTLWDLAPIAYLVNNNWTPSYMHHCPSLLDGQWHHDPSRRLIKVVRYVDRNEVFKDLFLKLSSFP